MEYSLGIAPRGADVFTIMRMTTAQLQVAGVQRSSGYLNAPLLRPISHSPDFEGEPDHFSILKYWSLPGVNK